MLGGPALLTLLLTLLRLATWEESSPYSEWGASNGVGRDIKAIHTLALLTSSGGSFLETLLLVGLRDAGNVPRHHFGKEGEGCRSYWSPLG
jgi:hypothetical protein